MVEQRGIAGEGMIAVVFAWREMIEKIAQGGTRMKKQQLDDMGQNIGEEAPEHG